MAALCVFLCAAALVFAQANAPAAGAPQFAYGGDAAQLSAQFTDHLIFLSAAVNQSKPSLFQLDTTAARSSIAPDRAKELGLENISAPVLSLVGLDVPLASLPSTPKPDFGSRVGQEYEGTAGRDILAGIVLQVDYSRQTVRAFAPASYKYSGKGSVFPLKAAALPVIPIRFALERGKEIEANFVVDTALDAPVVFENKFLAAHHMLNDRGKTMPTIDPLSGTAGATEAKLRVFEIGKSPVDDVLGMFSDQTLPDVGVPVAGAIGSEMLRRFSLVIDYPHSQISLEPNVNFPDPDQEDKSGLRIIAKGPDYKTFEVVDVIPHTPATDAGIQKGDIIAGIDTDPAADLSLLAARGLFCQVGHKYKLTVQRGDQTKEITLQMRRYF